MRKRTLMRQRLFPIFTTLFVLLSLVLSNLSGGSNSQKIYPIKSEAYTLLSALYLDMGLSPPSSAGPWSQAELEMMLDRIPISTLDEGRRTVYDKICNMLGIDHDGVFFVPIFNLETYTHANTGEAFQERKNWRASQHPLFDFSFDALFAENYALFLSIPLANVERPINDNFGSIYFGTNIFGFYNVTRRLDFMDFDINIPKRTYVAAGKKGISFSIGRDMLSWGRGKSGNFILSDNLPYHNVIRIAAYTEAFKYTYVVSFFPHPKNYYDESGNLDLSFSQNDYYSGLKAFIAHHIEGRMLDGRFTLAFSEGIMYQNAEGHADMQAFFPSMIYHNLYQRSNANSIAAIEMDITPFRGLNFYFQCVLDDAAISGENSPGKAASAFPNAMGYMIGLDWQRISKKGILSLSFESAYTDPFLYLRYGVLENGTEVDRQTGYGLNYVVAIRNFGQNDSAGKETSSYDLKYMGYRYGGDAIVCNFNVAYATHTGSCVSANLFGMAHGTCDMYTLWSKVTNGSRPDLPDAGDMITPTTDQSNLQNEKDANASTRDSVEFTLVAGFAYSKMIYKGFTLFFQLDAIQIWNSGNRSGNENDVQLTLGFTATL